METTNTRRISLTLCAIPAALLLISLAMGACSPSDSPTSPTAPPEATLSAGAATREPAEAPKPTEVQPDPDAIPRAWEEGPHAATFVVDADGKNSSCARCHAPANWIPTMDDMPETCLTCKFEVDPPPPYIAEEEWTGVECKICHRVDKKGVVESEVAWLEIAAIDEYAEVTSPSELCEKCHTEADLPDHRPISVTGAMAGFSCTDCHDAHDTSATCAASGCHEGLLETEPPIEGHDEEHQAVACVACHDAGNLDVGPWEEQGIWTTFLSMATEGEASIVPFTSHNIQLEAECTRCHFADNPWGLSDTVSTP